jgi:hypothetical protein
MKFLFSTKKMIICLWKRDLTVERPIFDIHIKLWKSTKHSVSHFSEKISTIEFCILNLTFVLKSEFNIFIYKFTKYKFYRGAVLVLPAYDFAINSLVTEWLSIIGLSNDVLTW